MTRALPEPETFLSGETGHVAGARRTLLRTTGDRALDLWLETSARRLDRLAAATPRRRVLVLSVYRPASTHIEAAVAELTRTRHDIRLALGSIGPAADALKANTAAAHLDGGKFQNLNALLPDEAEYDWLLVVDDDVGLPQHFLDRFVAICERFDLALAQPAQTLMSHAAWRVTRRRAGSLLRETRFVEIGPVTAFRRNAAAHLTPFPELRYGWGLDLHWGAVAAQQGWRLGVVDALPVKHEGAPVATAYRHEDAIEEARAFLAERPFVRADEAQQTLARHWSLAR